MHAVVGELQKRTESLEAENRHLRRLSGEAELPRQVPRLEEEVEEVSEPLDLLLEAEALRPWPLRTVRKAVAPLRPRQGSASPVRLVVRLMPKAMSGGRAVEKVSVTLSLASKARELQELLAAELSWPRAGGEQDLGLQGHLLLHGKALAMDVALEDQSVEVGFQWISMDFDRFL